MKHEVTSKPIVKKMELYLNTINARLLMPQDTSSILHATTADLFGPPDDPESG
jgi:hypothetical protein